MSHFVYQILRPPRISHRFYSVSKVSPRNWQPDMVACLNGSYQSPSRDSRNRLEQLILGPKILQLNNLQLSGDESDADANKVTVTRFFRPALTKEDFLISEGSLSPE